jgi:AcrR family transcriptional regulator
MRRRSGPPEAPSDDPSEEADARERILRTAHGLFRRHGVTAIGVDRIVEEAGVAKTTLYRHYGSKDALVVAVLERHGRLWIWDWLEAEVERRATTPATRILAIFDAFDDWFRQETYEGCLFTNTLLETHDRPGPVRSAAAEKLSEVRSLLGRLAEDAGVRDPVAFAQQLQMLMLGSIVLAVQGDAGAALHARGVAQVMLADAS